MGDYADMVLDGLLDEETGEYIGDHNLEEYGSEAAGFPVSLNRKPEEPRGGKVKCPQCNKRVKVAGLEMHTLAVHGS